MTGGNSGTPGPVPLLGIMADPHIGQSQAEGLVRTCIAWLLDRGVSAILVAGDLNERPGEPGFGVWARDPQGGGLPPEVQIVPCVGNWDTEVPPGVYDQTPIWPHATMQTRHDMLFQGREYFRWSVGGLSVFSLNNLTPYLTGAGVDAYANCNPPGSRTVLNPDHSGITVPSSAERVWLDEQADLTRDMPWKAGLMHRPPWSNYDTDPRRMHRDCREPLTHAIDCGLSLVVSGDQHVGCLSGPWYPPEVLVEPGGVGAYCLVLMGGYQCRPIDNALLPEGSILWSRGSSPVDPVCHAATLALGEDIAWLAIFEASNADPQGRVVWAQNIARNPGV